MIKRSWLLMVLLAAVAGVAGAATVNVPLGGDIQAAIDAAAYGDTIQLAKGEYNQRIDFKGKNLILLGVTEAFIGPSTTLNGEGGGTVVTFSQGETSFCTLRNLRIRNGSAAYGGGISCTNNSNPTFINCRIYGNSATQRGGGVYSKASSPRLTNVTVTQNTATGSGGGIYAEGGGTVTITGGSISQNVGLYGAGMMANNTLVTITDVDFLQNTATDSGGGLYAWEPPGGTVRQCRFEGNAATVSGGALYVRAGSLSITENEFTGNSAAASGGAVTVGFSGAATFSDNTFTGNSAGTYGGALAVASAASTLRSCSFVGNTAQDGGAVDTDGQSPIPITHCSFTNNTATRYGGALKFYNGSNTPLRHLSFWGNQAPEGAAMRTTGTVDLRNSVIAGSKGGIAVGAMQHVSQVAYCCFYGNSGGNMETGDPVGSNGNISKPPLFVDAANGDLHLRSQQGRWSGAYWLNDAETSPCIDAGDPAAEFASEPAPNGGRVNMGAYGNTSRASKTYESYLVTHSPTSDKVNVSRHTVIYCTFRKAVYPTAVASRFTVTPVGGTAVAGRIEWVTPARKLKFTPTEPLPFRKLCQVRIAPGVRYRDGSPASKQTEGFDFTTAAAAVVTGFWPSGTGIARGRNIKVAFDRPMDQASAEGSFSITPSVAGAFSWSGNAMTFDPTPLLEANTLYSVSVGGSGCKTATGIGMGMTYGWNFRTVATAGMVVSASAAPTASGAQVTVNLTEAAAVTVAVLNVAGRTVATLPEQSLPAGVSTLLWDGRGTQGALAPRGTYLMQVTARAAAGQQARCLASLHR